MLPAADWKDLSQRLGYAFKDRQILTRALTHKSHPAEKASPDPAPKSTDSDNEQLEFLGDSILGFLVSEALYESFPDYPEGKLSKLKSWLVSASHLHSVAASIGLGDSLLLGKGEEMSGGRAKRAILSNALEALLAAIYLDGGMDPARHFVREFVLPDTSGDTESVFPPALTDYKSALQELALARSLPQPKYVTVGERGPEHAKTFTVEVRVGKTLSSRAEGASKKDAGQRAAQLMLSQIVA